MGEYHRDEPDLGLINKPTFTTTNTESPRIASLIKTLSLEPHIEGGYYSQTDTSYTTIASPYPAEPLSDETVSLMGLRPDYDASLRRLSTTIFYYLTPVQPQGHFHRNRSRIIHTLHRGRGRYVCIHPDGGVETFVVGQNVESGEKLQWVVEGGVWKASFLLDAKDGENEGLLISETVVPGFEFADHEFLSEGIFKTLLPEEKARELQWLVRNHGEPQETKLDDSQGLQDSGLGI
ncbi:hypothetical protein G7046_g4589 [Stylonectria norvegica]|nr:hypothetical protein G7046_g4589 [Stylonectria norvegica]